MIDQSGIKTLEYALVVIKDLEDLVERLKKEIKYLETRNVNDYNDLEQLERKFNNLEYDNNLQIDLMSDIGLTPNKIENMSVYQVMQIDELLKQVEW